MIKICFLKGWSVLIEKSNLMSLTYIKQMLNAFVNLPYYIILTERDKTIEKHIDRSI